MYHFVILVSILVSTVPVRSSDVDNKAMESEVTRTVVEGGATSSRAGATLVPPIPLMLAVPHPSGRYLVLLPASSHLVPLLAMPPIYQQDHPAIFAAKHQLLFSGPTSYQQKERHQQTQQATTNRVQNEYRHRHHRPQHPNNSAYLRRLPVEVV